MATPFIDFRPAEVRKNKETYILYYVLDPASDKLKRMRGGHSSHRRCCLPRSTALSQCEMEARCNTLSVFTLRNIIAIFFVFSPPPKPLPMNYCRPYRFVHPLRGCVNTRGNAIGYRYVSPNGDGFPVTYSVTHSLTDHSLLITVHSSHTFSAKEKDSETGLSYFGARYYSSDLSIWLSVDPMSDKYPSLSPYVYCADNPVRCVDPNGEELEVANNEESHNDILSIVNDYNRHRITFGEDGKVSVNMDGVKVPDAGLSLINDMVNSDKKFYYETSDVALCRDKDGNRKTVSLISEQSLGCLNASVGGLDSQGEHTFLPIEGFDGQVVITKTGSFHYGSQNRRRNIVYHELAENYLRTDQGLNYFGNGMAGRGGAHQTAASWEFAAWGTMEPGTAQFTPGNPTSLISSFNRDKNYLINGIYK